MTVRIGFEVGSGAPVDVALKHLCVTGLTQESGKTTALEAFSQRVGGTTLVFRTGRGEIGFNDAIRVPPYFRERTDWQFVEGLISAHLHEKAKFYRGDLMRSVRGAATLAAVHANIRKSLASARKGSFTEKIYTELDQYLSEIIPSLGAIDMAHGFELEPGRAHVMDLEQLPDSVQQLVISSVVDRVMVGGRNVVLILPEGRKFIPEDRRTPAKLALETLITQGAKLQNFLWIDSQAMTGLDMDILRSVGTWLFGRQTLDIECKRIAKMIPGRKVKAQDVQALGLGQFFLVQGEDVTKVYVQPAWLHDDIAYAVARGELKANTLTKPKEDPKVDEEEREELHTEIAHLEATVEKLQGQFDQAMKEAHAWKDRYDTEHCRAEANAKLAAVRAVDSIKHAPTPVDIAAVLGAETDRQALSGIPVDWAPERVMPGADVDEAQTFEAPAERTKADLHVYTEAPELTIHVKVVTIEASGDDLRGQVAQLLKDGFLDEKRSVGQVARALLKIGGKDYTGGSAPTLKRELIELSQMRFLVRRGNTEFIVSPEAKARIRVVKGH